MRALERDGRCAAVAEPLGRAVGRLSLGDDPLARCLRGEDRRLPVQPHFCDDRPPARGAVDALRHAIRRGGGGRECCAALDALGYSPTRGLNAARAAICAQHKSDGERCLAAAKREHARVLKLEAPMAAGALVAAVLVHADAGAGDTDALLGDAWVCASAMEALGELWKSSAAGAAAVEKADGLPRAVGAALAVHFGSEAVCRAAERAAVGYLIGTAAPPDFHGWSKITYTHRGAAAVGAFRDRKSAAKAALEGGLSLAQLLHGQRLFDEMFLNVPRMLREE